MRGTQRQILPSNNIVRVRQDGSYVYLLYYDRSVLITFKTIAKADAWIEKNKPFLYQDHKDEIEVLNAYDVSYRGVWQAHYKFKEVEGE